MPVEIDSGTTTRTGDGQRVPDGPGVEPPVGHGLAGVPVRGVAVAVDEVVVPAEDRLADQHGGAHDRDLAGGAAGRGRGGRHRHRGRQPLAGVGGLQQRERGGVAHPVPLARPGGRGGLADVGLAARRAPLPRLCRGRPRSAAVSPVRGRASSRRPSFGVVGVARGCRWRCRGRRARWCRRGCRRRCPSRACAAARGPWGAVSTTRALWHTPLPTSRPGTTQTGCCQEAVASHCASDLRKRDRSGVCGVV